MERRIVHEQAKTVEVDRKVAHLRQPASYPHGPARVEVRETHMSWVFLAGDRVFKMKKPVRHAFLDFSTLGARARFVREEVRLNRRLAPEVYRGAVTLTLEDDGALRLDGSGQVVEWLVEMRRLPEDRMLDRLIEAGAVTRADVAAVGRRLADFYRALPSEPIAPEAYIGHLAAQFAETARVLQDDRFSFGDARVAAVIAGFECSLEEARPLLDARARAGRIIEGHGDLRPEHVCLAEPLAIIDCLEFDRDLRLVDPFDEIAFLGLECARLGADWVFPILHETLETGLDDAPPVPVLKLYWRYRALLRARIALLHLAEPNPRTPEKWRPLASRYVALAEEADLRFRSPRDR